MLAWDNSSMILNPFFVRRSIAVLKFWPEDGIALLDILYGETAEIKVRREQGSRGAGERGSGRAGEDRAKIQNPKSKIQNPPNRNSLNPTLFALEYALSPALDVLGGLSRMQ